MFLLPSSRVTLFNRLASAIALPLHLAKLPWIFATDPSSQLGVSDHHVARYCIRSYALAGFRGTRWATLAMRSALSAASGEIEYGCRCNVGARAEDRTCTQTSSCPRRIDRRPKTLALSDAKTQSCSLRSLAATTTDPSQPWALLSNSRVCPQVCIAWYTTRRRSKPELQRLQTLRWSSTESGLPPSYWRSLSVGVRQEARVLQCGTAVFS